MTSANRIADDMRHSVMMRRELPPTRSESPQAFACASTVPARRWRRVPKLLTAGTLIDHYRIEEILGVGGSAEVYRATNLPLLISVALKIVPTEDRQAVHFLFEEARCAARVQHPNVVKIRDVCRSGEHAYIAMEYIEGRSLAKLLESTGPLHPSVVTSIALDICAALQACRTHGVVHRDVKPGNIVVMQGGAARLIDFGVAFVPGEHAGPFEREGKAVGTIGYIAPEQMSTPRGTDFRADVYSLGVTMIQALLGLTRHSTVAPQLGRCAPAPLVRLLREMTDPSPDRRPPSYETLLARLRGVHRTLVALKASS